MIASNRAIDKTAFLSLAQKRKFMFLLDSFGGYNSGRIAYTKEVKVPGAAV
jgi:hypothetical protein